MKKVSEIFSDYKSGKNISNAVVEHVILKKKSKKVEIIISSDNYIEMDEIEGLNFFVKKRFYLNDSKVTINYTDNVVMKPLEEEIDNILKAIAAKHPLLKGH